MANWFLGGLAVCFILGWIAAAVWTDRDEIFPVIKRIFRRNDA